MKFFTYLLLIINFLQALETIDQKNLFASKRKKLDEKKEIIDWSKKSDAEQLEEAIRRSNELQKRPRIEDLQPEENFDQALAEAIKKSNEVAEWEELYRKTLELSKEEIKQPTQAKSRHKGTQDFSQEDFEEIKKIIIDDRKIDQDSTLLKFEDESGADEAAGVVTYRSNFNNNMRYKSIFSELKGAGIYYGPKGVEITGKNLHESGHLMEHQDLKLIFFNATAWYYYTDKFLNFLISFKYEDNPFLYMEERVNCIQLARLFKIDDLKSAFTLYNHPHYSKGKVSKIDRSHKAFKELMVLVKNIRLSLETFKENDLLIKLGMAFQRWKVVLEKLPAQGNHTVKECRKIADRMTTDLQIMIYHLMKEAYAEFVKKYELAATPELRTNAGNFLATFEPNFKEHTYYKKIIQSLEVLTKPVKTLNGIKL